MYLCTSVKMIISSNAMIHLLQLVKIQLHLYAKQRTKNGRGLEMRLKQKCKYLLTSIPDRPWQNNLRIIGATFLLIIIQE